MPSDALLQAQQWLKKADADLRTIHILLADTDPPLDTVCFHAQQAAEKLLKALLTAHRTPFPKPTIWRCLSGIFQMAHS